MKKFAPLLFILGVVAILAVVITSINHSEKSVQPASWSAFIYTHGYNSGRYDKKDDFADYQQCKAYAEQQSALKGDVAWQCGLNCRFNNSRQGFQCETMKNH
ncbi:hypothetical protein [Shewanella waksmanii]|uniref:hypothetical protein n=1 Tax=Shewanella waksmanii TaxID=213783 RepID=UPI003735744E